MGDSRKSTHRQALKETSLRSLQPQVCSFDTLKQQCLKPPNWQDAATRIGTHDQAGCQELSGQHPRGVSLYVLNQPLSIQLPLSLHFSACSHGGLDLHVQLIQLNLGSYAELPPPRHGHASPAAKNTLPGIWHSDWGTHSASCSRSSCNLAACSSMQASTANAVGGSSHGSSISSASCSCGSSRWCGSASSKHAAGLQPQRQRWHHVSGWLSTAVALAALVVMRPESMPSSIQAHAVPGVFAAAALSAAGDLGLKTAQRFRNPNGRKKKRQRHGQLAMIGLLEQASHASQAVSQFMWSLAGPATALLMLNSLWGWALPHSHRVAEALLALVAVQMGYNQLEADTASGRLQAGAQVEAEWRRRHKKAARHVAHYLSDMPATPPLKPASDMLHRLSIAAGVAVDGRGLCGIVHDAAASLKDGRRLALSGSLVIKRTAKQTTYQQTHLTPQVANPSTPGDAISILLSNQSAALPKSIQSNNQSAHNQPSYASDITHNYMSAQPHSLSPTLPTNMTSQLPAMAAQIAHSERQSLSTLSSISEPETPVTLLRPGRPVLDSSSELHKLDMRVTLTTSHAPSQKSCTSSASASQQTSASSSLCSPKLQSSQHSQKPQHGALPEANSNHASSRRRPPFLNHPNQSVYSQSTSSLSSNADVKDDAASTRVSRHVPSSKQSHAATQLSSSKHSQHNQIATADTQASSVAVRPDAHAYITDTLCTRTTPAHLFKTPCHAASQTIGSQESNKSSDVLPLFGKGDHLLDMQTSFSLSDRLQLGSRSVYLLGVFLPFIVIGIPLLLLSILVTRWVKPHVRQVSSCSTGQPGDDSLPLPRNSSSRESKQILCQHKVGASTANHSTGSTTSSSTTHSGSNSASSSSSSATAIQLRKAAWKLLLAGCRCSGAAFIKWGQWAATRGDLFPPDFCNIMSSLHDRAPVHSFAHTKREIEAAFGRRLQDMFVRFEEKPVASGSIGQVHRASMLIQGQLQEVAVKVCHPGVAKQIYQDFQVLRPLAAAASRFRSLKGLSLKESVSQFSHTMTAQADLRVEAAHLARSGAGFAHLSSSIIIPQPIAGLVSSTVLVETWEPGQNVAQYIRTPTPLNTQIVALGVGAYLNMLLKDNFVHTDLHPGNILVRFTPDSNGNEKAQMVLLDFGLAEELNPTVRHHFLSFLHHIMSGNGRAAAGHILKWAKQQDCPHPEVFVQDMILMFKDQCDVHKPDGIDLDAVMKQVLQLARKHEVTIDSGYASLVIGVCVIVGLATSLDRQVNLIDAAVPCFLMHSLTGRVMGRLYG